MLFAQATDFNQHLRHLKRAALLALRGHGGAEPNPLVGCIIVDQQQRTVGWGYHRLCGGPHAEIIALQRAAEQARGATLYCTLEPCNHHGRTGPCTRAIIRAGVARVIIARRDPFPPAAGGFEALHAAGIDTCVVGEETDVVSHCTSSTSPAHHATSSKALAFARGVSQPFVHRLATGRPWVTVKWAQTVDGFIATRPPHCKSQWISNEASRRMVHRERGRVDAIITGVGTILADDCLLTPRDVRLRRAPMRPDRDGRPLRVVVDPRLRTPLDSKIVTTAHHTPTILACGPSALHSSAEKAEAMRSQKVGTVPLLETKMSGADAGFSDGEYALEPLLRWLVKEHDVAHVLVEAGPTLLGSLFRQKLVNEAWVFTAPITLGDQQAISAINGCVAERLADGIAMQLWSLRRRGGDVIARYLVPP